MRPDNMPGCLECPGLTSGHWVASGFMCLQHLHLVLKLFNYKDLYKSWKLKWKSVSCLQSENIWYDTDLGFMINANIVQIFECWNSGLAIGCGPSRTTLFSLSLQTTSCFYFTLQLFKTWRQPGLSRDWLFQFNRLVCPPAGRSVWPCYVCGHLHLKSCESQISS
jgi:hypothetical protein